MQIDMSEEYRSEVLGLVQRWKDRDGNLIMVLHEVQKTHGYIPRGLAIELSRELEVPLARIYEVITFYNFFKTTPPARHKISVCLGTACYLNGAPELIAEIKNLLHVEEEKTTEDGQFNLNIVRCLGCCGLAPVIMIDDKIYGHVRRSDVMSIISEYTGEEEHAGER